jgi:hypothetical protein
MNPGERHVTGKGYGKSLKNHKGPLRGPFAFRAT